MGTTIAVIFTSNRDEPGAVREGSGDEYAGHEGLHEDDSDRQGFNSRTQPSPKGISMAAQKICQTIGIGQFSQVWSDLGSEQCVDSAPREPSFSEWT